MRKGRDLNRRHEDRTEATQAISNPGRTPGPPATNPFSEGRTGTTGGTGGVNPSGPTSGTEAWGLGQNEANTAGDNQGNMDSDLSTDTVSTERDRLPLGERTFRCADAGNADCRWETAARTEDELMDSIERHGREAHGITNFDSSTRRKFQDAIRERRAA